MKDEQIIKKIIIDLKEILINLDANTGREFTLEFDSSSDFEGKNNYPIDFQIFVEEFGFGEIGDNDVLLICTVVPQVIPFSEIQDDYIPDDPSPEGILEGTNTTYKDARLVGYTASGEVFGYDKKTIPYKFITTLDPGEPIYGSFLEFLSVQIKWGPMNLNKNNINENHEYISDELRKWYKSLIPLASSKYFFERYAKLS